MVSNRSIALFLIAIILFFTYTCYFMFSEIIQPNNLHFFINVPFLSYFIKNINLNVAEKYNSIDSRTISITNKLGFDINLYYEGEDHSLSSVFMTKIDSLETADFSALSGNTFFYTEIDENARLGLIVIQDSSNEYIIGNNVMDTNSKTGNNNNIGRKLSVEFRKRPHPAVKELKEPRTHAMNAKFLSMSSKEVELWFDDHNSGLFQAHLKTNQESSTNTYEGHHFFVTEKGNKERVIAKFTMVKEKSMYVIYDELYPANKDILDASRKEEEFMSDYYNRTGLLWRHYFGPNGPRPPPTLYMWPASEIGEVHNAESNNGLWLCDGTPQSCQSKDLLTLELEVISLEPRAFIIKDFLSQFETDEIIRNAQPKLAKSQVGDSISGILESNTRTSRNSWIPRTSSSITDTLFRRAADLLQLDEGILHKKKNAEDIQVVNYKIGQKYDSHHDWGCSGYPESRLITLLLYLTDQPDENAGGETSFPKAGGKDGRGIKVHPGKGSAVLFYNLLEDGNGDDLALHAALPVKHGEKWLANFWVWDPKFH